MAIYWCKWLEAGQNHSIIRRLEALPVAEPVVSKIRAFCSENGQSLSLLHPGWSGGGLLQFCEAFTQAKLSRVVKPSQVCLQLLWGSAVCRGCVPWQLKVHMCLCVYWTHSPQEWNFKLWFESAVGGSPQGRWIGSLSAEIFALRCVFQNYIYLSVLSCFCTLLLLKVSKTIILSSVKIFACAVQRGWQKVNWFHSVKENGFKISIGIEEHLHKPLLKRFIL